MAAKPEARDWVLDRKVTEDLVGPGLTHEIRAWLTELPPDRLAEFLIGGENPVEDMRECSLITSTYTYRGQVLGVLGVIGPRRMQYGDVISLVDETARLVSDSLSRVQRELYLPG